MDTDVIMDEAHKDICSTLGEHMEEGARVRQVVTVCGIQAADGQIRLAAAVVTDNGGGGNTRADIEQAAHLLDAAAKSLRETPPSQRIRH
jgi:hypothetical protein